MQSKDLIIVPAGGQAKNVSLIIEQIGGWNILGLADDNPDLRGKEVRSYPILGSLAEVCERYDNINFVINVGNPDVLKKLVEYIKSTGKNFSFPNIIHPSSQIPDVQMGEGNIIFPDCLFLAECTIGNFNFFNFKSAVSHEAVVGDYCLIQPGVNLLGKTVLKDRAYCGANSTIIEKRIIGENATIGAGAVVTKDVEANTIVVGNPAKLLRYKE